MRYLLFFLSLISYPLFAADVTPVGEWKTVDDVSGEVRSIVQIFETEDHLLSGKIIKTFPKPDVAPLKICSKCSDARHNQPIIGMVIMSKLQFADNQVWKNGEILDPTNGKIYHCKIKLTDNAQKLAVRGYIGVPLFGRSQTWLRVN
jgi:hypothetical protein